MDAAVTFQPLKNSTGLIVRESLPHVEVRLWFVICAPSFLQLCSEKQVGQSAIAVLSGSGDERG